MEKQFQLTNNGQQVITDDFNQLGETSGLADDRVFAELLRMKPYNGSTVTKGVLPFNHIQSSGSIAGLVNPNGATGSVLINPFRVFIGPRTAVATDAKKNWRDIRSAIVVGTSALTQTISFAAIATGGNDRWDLIYAAVSVDANAAGVTRKLKNPTTGVISSATVVVDKVTTVTLGVVQGVETVGVSVWPSLPADSGSVYYVPISYVHIPNGFSAGTTTIDKQSIFSQAPVIQLSNSSGAVASGPADQQYVLTPTQQHSAASTRPTKWMPPEMTGGYSMMIALDLLSASSANWSHQDADVVDSRDWRNRLTKWVGAVDPSHPFAWDASEVNALGTGSNTFPGPELNTYRPDGSTILHGFGNTIIMTSGRGNAAKLTANAGSGGEAGVIYMNTGSEVLLYVDETDGGKLKVAITGTPLVKIFFWIDFSGVFPNCRA